MSPGRPPVVFLKTRFREANGSFSPDGRWVAYMSDQSGRFEIDVRAFNAAVMAGGSPADGGREWQVSIAGGVYPLWSPKGQEVCYLSPAGEMMAVPIAVTASAIAPGTPVRLFSTNIVGGGTMVDDLRQYDVAPDGRFPINTMLDTAIAPVTLLMHWNPDAPR